MPFLKTGAPRPRLCCLALTMLAASLLAACSGGDGSETGQALVQTTQSVLDAPSMAAPVSGAMAGTVFVDAAVSGATVDLWTPTGVLIATATSDPGGFFNFTGLGALPRDFVVSAHGGTYRNEPFRGKLLLVRDDYGDSLQVLSLNLLSTFAARVLETATAQHRSMTPAQAVARTRSYFALPPTYDIGTLRSPAFDPSRFLVANPLAGLDRTLADAAVVAVGIPDAGQAYPEPVPRLSGADLAVKAGASLYQYGLDWLGRNFGDPFAPTTSTWGMAAAALAYGLDDSSRFDQIDRALAGISGQLADLGNHVTTTEARLNERLQAAAAGSDRLEDTTRFAGYRAGYAAAASAMAAPKAQIDGLHRIYLTYLNAERGQVTPRQWDELASEIRLKVPPAIAMLKTLQTGVGAGIRNWHLLQAMSTPGYPTLIGSDFYEALNQQQDFVAGVQLLGLNLLLEASNYESVRDAQPKTPAAFAAARSSAIAPLLAAFEADVGAQQALVPPRLDPGLVTDVYNGRTFVRTLAAFPKPAGPLVEPCSVLSMQWTERTVTGTRVLGEGSSRRLDCELPMPNATQVFNAFAPFGATDWALGPLPGFPAQPAVATYAILKANGFDMGANQRLGILESASSPVGLPAGTASRTVDLWNLSSSPMLAFSRPSPVDPAARACVLLPASGSKPLRLDCSGM